MNAQDTPVECKPDLPLEIANILFIDVVGYPKLLVNEQIELLQELNRDPAALASRGLLRMFQMTRVFPRISAFDNLITAGLARGLSEKETQSRAEALLEELTLAPVQYLDAGQLSGGQRKLLEFGMCFIAPPRLALLDEPFAAVHPVMRETMAGFIRRRNAEGHAFLVVSHDMPIVVDLCNRAACMNAGRLIAAGPTRDVLKDPAVIEAYLGSGSHA